MDCVSWVTWVFSGVGLVAVLAWMKCLPQIGPVIDKWGVVVAPILALLSPLFVQTLTPYCGRIDPLAWDAIFAVGVFIISQITYLLAKRAGAQV